MCPSFQVARGTRHFYVKNPSELSHLILPYPQTLAWDLMVNMDKNKVYKPRKRTTPPIQSTTKIHWNQTFPRITSCYPCQTNNNNLLPCEPVTSSRKVDRLRDTEMTEELTELLFGEAGEAVSKGRIEWVDCPIFDGLEQQGRLMLGTQGAYVDFEFGHGINLALA